MFSKIPIAIFLFFLSLSFYIGVSRFTVSTDAMPTSYLPVALIRGEGFNLEKIYPHLIKITPANAEGLSRFIIHENNNYISVFPVFSAILATPIYAIPVLIQNITIDNLESHFDTIVILGTLSASLFSAISVALVFLSLKSLTSSPRAFVLAVLYALATSTLSISSQSLMQHAASQMFLAASIYYFVRGQKTKKLLALTGLFLGLATLSRFIDVVLALSFTAYIALYEKRQLAKYLIYVLPSVLFFSWYQIAYTGNLFFYRYEGVTSGAGFNSPFLLSLTGLLIAPSKGLLVYSPIFIFSIIGTILAWMKKKRVLQFTSFACVLFILAMSKWSGWQGGWSYGPRMLADITPFLILLLVPVVESKIWNSKIFKFVFFLLAIISISIHLLGALTFDNSWYALRSAFLTGERAAKADFLWSLKYPELYYYYLHSGGFFGIIFLFSTALLHILTRLLQVSVVFLLLWAVVSIVWARLRPNKSELEMGS